MIHGFRDLVVWQRAMSLVVEAYRAVSIPSNIAEGRGRFGLGGFIYHLSVATGSLMELETQVMISVRLDYLKAEQAQTLLETIGEVRRLLAAMVRSLRTKKGANLIAGS